MRLRARVIVPVLVVFLPSGSKRCAAAPSTDGPHLGWNPTLDPPLENSTALRRRLRRHRLHVIAHGSSDQMRMMAFLMDEPANIQQQSVKTKYFYHLTIFQKNITLEIFTFTDICT